MTAVAKLQLALGKLERASAFAAGSRFDKDAILTAANVRDAAQTALLAGELQRLSDSQKQALCRSLAAVLSPMASLEQPLQAALRAPLSDQGMYGRLWAAACAVEGGATLAMCLDPLPAVVAAALAAGASLLVAAGTPVLANLANPAGRQALRRVFPDDPLTRVDRIVKLLADCVAHVGSAVLNPTAVLMQELLGQASPATGRRALLKGAFAPRRLLPFLSAMAAAMMAAADDAADVIDLAYPSAAHLLSLLLVTYDHPKLQAALAADNRLSEQLTRLLLRCLGAAAAGSYGDSSTLQPSADRVQVLRSEVCGPLISPTLHEPLRRLLHSDAHAALAALHDAAAVLRQLPLQPCGNDAAGLWGIHYGAATLVSNLLGLLPGRTSRGTADGINRSGPAPPPEQERPLLLRQAGQIAVETLPAMAAAAAAARQLVASTAEPSEWTEAAQQFHLTLSGVETLRLFGRYQHIVLATTDAPPISTTDELLEWLAAAGAMLCLLPVPAELAAEVAAQPPGVVPADLRNLAAELAHRCVGVFSQAAVMADDFLRGLDPADRQPVADAALPALAALHSRACRLVHWSQAGGPQRSALIGAALPGSWPAVASRVAGAYLNTTLLLQAKLATLEAEDAVDSPLAQDIRLMHASLAAAHLEALAVLGRCMDVRSLLFSSVGSTPGRRVLASIATAVSEAPACALSSPAWHSLRNSIHQLLQEPEAPGWGIAQKAATVNLLLWTGGPLPPHAAVALLPSIAAVMRQIAAAPTTVDASPGEAVSTFAEFAAGSLAALANAHGEAFGIAGQGQALLEGLGGEPLAICQRLMALLPTIEQQAAELHVWQQQPEQLQPALLNAGRAAAVRARAYLACPNVGAEGGMVAGQGAGAKRCGGCRSVWYCGPACSRADWKQHKLVCPLLKAESERRTAGKN